MDVYGPRDLGRAARVVDPGAQGLEQSLARELGLLGQRRQLARARARRAEPGSSWTISVARCSAARAGVAEIAPASRSSRARRARAIAAGRTRPARRSGPIAAGPAAERGFELGAGGPASSASGTIAHARSVADRRRDHARPEARGERARLASRVTTAAAPPGRAPSRRRRPPGASASAPAPPSSRIRTTASRRRCASPAASACSRGVTLGRDRRDLVDVGEDRLGQRGELLRVRRRRRWPPRRPAATRRARPTR